MKPEVERQKIGRRLREARESKGLSQEEVARMLRVKHQSVSGWEIGKTMPKSDTWYRLGRLYEVPLDYLVYGTPMMPVSEYAFVGWLSRPQGSRPSDEASGTLERQQES